MIGRLLCRLDFHHWAYAWGTWNRYYECRRCGARTVEIPSRGYQPIDEEWLDANKPLRTILDSASEPSVSRATLRKAAESVSRGRGDR